MSFGGYVHQQYKLSQIILFDHSASYMYWSDYFVGTLMQAKLDGTEVQTVTSTGVGIGRWLIHYDYTV